MNENESYIFHIEQPDEWRRTPDHFWIYGWFVPKNGQVYTDMRAYIDEVAFTGILGLPRLDIQQDYVGWTGDRAPGFAFRLEPWVGARTIRLEIMNRHGEWAEFWRVDIEIAGSGECSRHQPRLPSELVELLYLRLLKHSSLHPDRPLADHAFPLVQDHVIGLVEVLPKPPFRGQFEQPTLLAHTQYNNLTVLGWIFHEERRIKRLLATTNGNHYNELVHGIEREDVGQMYDAFPQARHSRFQGIIDIDQQAANPIPILVFAEFEDGTRELVFAKRVYQWSCLEKETRLPPYDEQHWHNVHSAVKGACRRLGVKTRRLGFWRETRRLQQLYEREAQDPLPWYDWNTRTPYENWVRNHRLTPALRQEFVAAANRISESRHPGIALVLDSRRADPAGLHRLFDSLVAQFYSHWQLTVVIRADADPAWSRVVQDLAGRDQRVRFFHGRPEENFAASMNDAIGGIELEWLLFIEPGSTLPPEGLLLLAEATVSPDIDLVLGNEDHRSAVGERRDPAFKPQWSPELIFSGTHPGEAVIMHRRLFEQAGCFDPKFEDLLPFSFALQLQATVDPRRTAHVDAITLHRAWPRPAGEYASVERRIQAISASLAKRGLPGQGFQPPFAVSDRRPVTQVLWNSSHLAESPVTVVIPTRDHCDLLERCIEALLNTVNWQYVKLIIVDDFSREARTVKFLQCLAARRDFSCRVIRPEVDPMQPFNYSRLVNTALPHVDTPLILHLNNDVDALRPGWIEEMAGWFSLPKVGVVGARLLYANDHLNHAGVIVGPHDGLADVPLAGLGPDEPAPYELHRLARNCTAVTGACLMTRTDLYRDVHGFDEGDLGVAYNDIDYCLRLKAAGYRTVYTPQAELWHWGSATRGTSYHCDEHIAFARRYPGIKDPYWSRFIKTVEYNVELDPYRYAHTDRLGSLHLLVVTHNLNYEGAPLFLVEYVQFMVERMGFKVDVIAAMDGPLHPVYERMGVNITVVDRHPLHGARTDREFTEQLELLRDRAGESIDLGRVDIVLANTLAGWWGVHLANLMGKPSLLYIHESTTVKRFFSRALPKKRHHVVRQVFRTATRVAFLCKATRAYFEELNDYDNYRLVSSWIDLERIEALKAATPRHVARERLGFGPDEQVIANIGTVCERKGQHVFLRTVEHFMKHFAVGGSYRFLIVGGRPGEFQDSLERDIARLGLGDVVTIVNETDRVYEYFRAANLFACSSFEESFPRVLLEAMAFETPIVSTKVHGVPEMVTNKAEAYLVPPGDPISFAQTIKTCLDKLLYGTSTVPMGYSKVVRAYGMNQVLPWHADFAREAVLAHDRDQVRTEPHRLSGRGDRVESSW